MKTSAFSTGELVRILDSGGTFDGTVFVIESIQLNTLRGEYDATLRPVAGQGNTGLRWIWSVDDLVSAEKVP